MGSFDETFDFVVAGSGGGSMCGGLLMRTLGKSVVILEKTQFVGGTTARSGGVMWIPNNPFMKRDGIEDSYEKAATYLEAVAGNQEDAPGATRERQHAYLTQAPRMLDFLIRQGIKLTRVGYWPDYYDEKPGGSKDGRTVVAELFNANELGPWREKLQPGFINMPAMLDDLMMLRTFKQSWSGKMLMLKVGAATLIAKLRRQNWVSAGAALQGRMLQAALKAGIDIRTDTPVAELIIEDGAVTGVIAQRDGKPWRVGARLGVLINAGGFSHNQGMRDRYQPGTSSKWSQVTAGDTGEMIEEMQKHGAAIAQMDAMVGYQTSLPPTTKEEMITSPMQGVTAAPHAILVDSSGVRYQNEGGSYMEFCANMLERNKTVPAVPSWAIYDTQFLKNYMLNGTMPGTKKPQAWFDSGYMHKADTIKALAAKINIDPATLSATIARFNGFVAQNKDEDFHRGDRAYDNWLGDPYHKPSSTLGAIGQGPFYAQPVVPGDVGTYGGVVTDTNARVLRDDGSVIPGLYATGISTASVMGRKYPGAGSSVGPSFVWGYVAAKHAAGADNSA